MTGTHNDLIRAQFGVRAATFTDAGFAARGSDWILERLAPAADEQVLDVAAGAAHLGRALASRVNHVSALDPTPAMLEQGQRLAAAGGLRNLTFTVGDAAGLPYLDGQFDLVVCRLALHRVADPATMVREMVRVTRQGGRIGLVDMIAEADRASAEEADRLERLRDPSHNRTLPLAEVQGLLVAAGAALASTALRDEDLDLEDWLARSRTPDRVSAQIRARFEEELAGGSATGLRPVRGADGALRFTHTWAVVTGSPRG
ncbi:class I SAM-dependent methyltransferase [Streptacidiphilus albus]|uniref:class I SAM-dependent methyltransferase n=1 Tax=Streptacidiphilus albus TaxID=105425 RepID=UPI00054BB765|nr:class I SAM-dependent methyltransferase [Streptacidiphilus albus]